MQQMVWGWGVRASACLGLLLAAHSATHLWEGARREFAHGPQVAGLLRLLNGLQLWCELVVLLDFMQHAVLQVQQLAQPCIRRGCGNSIGTASGVLSASKPRPRLLAAVCTYTTTSEAKASVVWPLSQTAAAHLSARAAPPAAVPPPTAWGLRAAAPAAWTWT